MQRQPSMFQQYMVTIVATSFHTCILHYKMSHRPPAITIQKHNNHQMQLRCSLIVDFNLEISFRSIHGIPLVRGMHIQLCHALFHRHEVFNHPSCSTTKLLVNPIFEWTWLQHLWACQVPSSCIWTRPATAQDRVQIMVASQPSPDHHPLPMLIK